MSWPEQPQSRPLHEWQRYVEQRGHALRRRRQVLLAASVSTAGVAVLVPVVLFSSSAPDHLRMVTPAGLPAASTPVAQQSSSVTPPPGGSPAPAPVGTASGSPGPGTPWPSAEATQTPSRPTTPATAATGYPLATSCSLDSVGLAAGLSRTCRFTATAVGGWLYDDSAGGAGFDVPQATLVVTRAGTTRTYRGQEPHSCADAVIRPGDRVRLTLTAPTTEVAVTYRAAAGRGFGCT